VPFARLIDRLAAGDEAAAREVHRRYTPRLIALARQHLPPAVRRRTDPESVIQSVYRSFFRRAGDGEFRLGDWDDLWGLLALVTLRKCSNRVRFHYQECRDVGREVGGPPEEHGFGQSWPVADPDPTPLEAAVLRETLTAVLAPLGERERRIVEGLLQGGTVDQVRRQVGCGERTVRRVRDRVRRELRALRAADV
jgi:RNA polymerase sigma-70 factor (ECF subfamily)